MPSSARALRAAAILGAGCLCLPPASADIRAAVRVLILGNTIGATWSAPAWTERIGRSSGRALTVEGSLYHYVESLAAQFSPTYNARGLAAIRGGGWSFVVLEENPYEPVLHRDSFFQSVAKLAAEARARGAEPILVEPFALGRGSIVYGEPWSGGSPERMQALLREACNEIASRLRLRQARVGDAFEWISAHEPGIELYENDKIHPSPCGAYLEACTLESVLDNRDAAATRWLPPQRVSEAQAEALRAAASAAGRPPVAAGSPAPANP